MWTIYTTASIVLLASGIDERGDLILSSEAIFTMVTVYVDQMIKKSPKIVI